MEKKSVNNIVDSGIQHALSLPECEEFREIPPVIHMVLTGDSHCDEKIRSLLVGFLSHRTQEPPPTKMQHKVFWTLGRNMAKEIELFARPFSLAKHWESVGNYLVSGFAQGIEQMLPRQPQELEYATGGVPSEPDEVALRFIYRFTFRNASMQGWELIGRFQPIFSSDHKATWPLDEKKPWEPHYRGPRMSK